jgi:hypothetical protein
MNKLLSIMQHIKRIFCFKPGVPLFLFSIPKSSSTNIHRILREIHLNNNGYIWKKPKYLIGTLEYKVVNHALRSDAFERLKCGGILNTHTSPENTTLYLLDKYKKTKYIILIRNPLDQLSAMYCHLLKERNAKIAKYDIFGPLDDIRNKSVDDGIKSIIENGYFGNVLKWINHWNKYRDRQRSIIIKYEDFSNDPIEFFNEISFFIYKKKITDNQKHMILNETKKVGHGKKTAEINLEYYPRGYTAGNGIWKGYISDENLKLIKIKYKEELLEINSFYPILLDL